MARVPFVIQFAVAAALGGGGYVLATSPEALPSAAKGVAGECNIKGNISVDTGERIYHMPGQRYYASTRIDPTHGERLFCSEADARRDGWRKSRV